MHEEGRRRRICRLCDARVRKERRDARRGAFQPPPPRSPIGQEEDTTPEGARVAPAPLVGRPPPEPREADAQLAEHRRDAKIRLLQEENRKLIQQLNLADLRQSVLDGIHEFEAPPIVRREISSGLREATAVVMASDWHVEERVEAEKVNGLNEFDLEIADRRVERYLESVLWLLSMHRERFQIRDMVLWLGGDFYSGYIHPELIETSQLAPTQSLLWLQVRLTRMIDTLLAQGGLERLTVLCNYGNHGRTTEKRRISTGAENSFEWLMYQFLGGQYANDPRVSWIAPRADFVYQDVYDITLRTTHGDRMTYWGGVGGLTIPLMKALKRWDESRHADITLMGHYHTYMSLEQAVVNGSLIGQTPFSMSFGFEPPRQSWFLIDSRRGKCCSTPIWVD